MAYLLSDAQKAHRYVAKWLPISAQPLCSFGGGDGGLIVLTRRAQRSHHGLKRQPPTTPRPMMQDNAWPYRPLTSSVLTHPARTLTLDTGARLVDSPWARSSTDVLRSFVGQEAGRRAPCAARFLFVSPVAGDHPHDVFT